VQHPVIDAPASEPSRHRSRERPATKGAHIANDIGIRVMELAQVPRALREEIVAHLAVTFHREWGAVDARYLTPGIAEAEIRRRMVRRSPVDLVFVALQRGRLLCTAGLARRDNPDFDAVRHDTGQPAALYGDGWLVDVCTVAEESGRGHATRLMERVKAAAAANGLPHLHLYAEERLVPFYERRGFTLVGREQVAAPDGRQSTQCVMRAALHEDRVTPQGTRLRTARKRPGGTSFTGHRPRAAAQGTKLRS
jgi:GNAT superfamily N-acetyltransferase